MRGFRKRPSASMVVACIALLVALSGVGIAAVTLPANSVGPAQIRSGAVRSSDVKNGSLRRIDFGAGALLRGPQGLRGPAGAAGPKGDKGEKGEAGERGPSDAYVDTTHDAPIVTIRTDDTRVATLRIPAAGAYVIWSKVSLEVSGTPASPTIVSCYFETGEADQTGQPRVFDPTDVMVPDAEETIMVNALAHSFAGPTTVNLGCQSGGTASAVNATVTAFRVGNLTTSVG